MAVISDVHGNLPALESVLADIAARGITEVLDLGDHASGPLWPRETVELVMRQPWACIAGNCDRQIVTQRPTEQNASDRYAFETLTLAQRQWLAALPATLTAHDEILLSHGTPSSNTEYLLESVEAGVAHLAHHSEIWQRLGKVSAPVVLCGHSHIPRIVRLPHTLIVNPGSVGLPAFESSHPEHQLMETGSPDARYAVLRRSERGWRAELIAVPYDHAAAQKQALKNDRADWEIALRTGYARE